MNDKLLLHAVIEKEGDRYSALCLEVDVATEGCSFQEAKKNLEEAVSGYLETVFANGLEVDLFPRLAPQREWRKYFQTFLNGQSSIRALTLSVSVPEVTHA